MPERRELCGRTLCMPSGHRALRWDVHQRFGRPNELRRLRAALRLRRRLRGRRVYAVSELLRRNHDLRWRDGLPIQLEPALRPLRERVRGGAVLLPGDVRVVLNVALWTSAPHIARKCGLQTWNARQTPPVVAVRKSCGSGPVQSLRLSRGQICGRDIDTFRRSIVLGAGNDLSFRCRHRCSKPIVLYDFRRDED